MENMEVNALILMKLFEKQETISHANVLRLIHRIQEQLEQTGLGTI